MKKPAVPAESERVRYLELCQELVEHAQLARNYAMKPGNAWLARAELGKVTALVSELEQLLETIKQADDNRIA